MLSVPLSSRAGGPGAFSPTVPLEQTPAVSGAAEQESVTIFADSTWKAPHPPVHPTTAMIHSLAFPGWGQLDNGRKMKAALLFVTEAALIGGYVYMNYHVKHDDVADWERENMRTDRNSFFIYWLAAKVYGMVDAYVDAHLRDFDVEDITPEELTEENDPPASEPER